MNVAWWIGFLGAGVVLGSCAGYSSLGELSNAGGEGGQADGMGGSQSMGAKAGQGRGGTHTMGGTQGMGATPGMVGGSNGMGATPGMVGGSNGMGAVGGSGTPELMPCMTDEQCPIADCADGASCPEYVCVNGYCGQTLPGAEPACAKLVCGDPCMAPDGTSGACDEAGECTQNQPSCSGAPAPIPCMTDEQCPIADCADGASCPMYVCVNGYCGQTLPGAEPACAKLVCGDPCMAPDGSVGTCDEAGECSGRMPVCGPAPMQ